MKLIVFMGIFGVVVAVCGFSVTRDWQAWALIVTVGIGAAWLSREEIRA